MENLNEFEFHPITKDPIILDFSECKTLWDIHSLLKRKFGFHQFYGANWDALWDSMRDVFEDGNYRVELISFHTIENDLKNECDILFEIFERVVNINPNFSYEIIS